VRCGLELEGLPIYHRRSVHRFVGFPPSGLTRAGARPPIRPSSRPIRLQCRPVEARSLPDDYPVNLAIVAWCTPIVFAIALQLSPAARRLIASPCW
jgi:hypothetical protein